jgi:hypothetical protein
VKIFDAQSGGDFMATGFIRTATVSLSQSRTEKSEPPGILRISLTTQLILKSCNWSSHFFPVVRFILQTHTTGSTVDFEGHHDANRPTDRTSWKHPGQTNQLCLPDINHFDICTDLSTSGRIAFVLGQSPSGWHGMIWIWEGDYIELFA